MCSLNEMWNWRPSECSSACRGLWALPSSGACAAAADPAALLGNAGNRGTANVTLLQPCKEECKLPDCFPCIVLWNCDKTQSRSSLSCSLFRDLLWQTCQQLHRVQSCGFCNGVVFGKSRLRLGWCRDKHHYLKTYRCFTYSVYPLPQFESGGFSLFEIYKYSPYCCVYKVK